MEAGHSGRLERYRLKTGCEPANSSCCFLSNIILYIDRDIGRHGHARERWKRCFLLVFLITHDGVVVDSGFNRIFFVKNRGLTANFRSHLIVRYHAIHGLLRKANTVAIYLVDNFKEFVWNQYYLNASLHTTLAKNPTLEARKSQTVNEFMSLAMDARQTDVDKVLPAKRTSCRVSNFVSTSIN